MKFLVLLLLSLVVTSHGTPAAAQAAVPTIPGSPQAGARATSHPPTVAGPPARLWDNPVLWGALIGAAAGTLSGLVVSDACGSYCAGGRIQGIALHVGVGTLLGAGVGAVWRELRRD